MSREHTYTLQIQPDWHIIVNNHLKRQPSTSTTQSQLDVAGGFGNSSVRLHLPTNQDPVLSRIWLNITRISPNNEQTTVFQNINLESRSGGGNDDAITTPAPLPNLTSDAVDVSDLTFTPLLPGSQPDPHHNHTTTTTTRNPPRSVSITLRKALPSRIIIQTTVHSPVGIYPHLHTVVNDSQRHHKQIQDRNDPTNMRLRPGDLDSDDEEATAVSDHDLSGTSIKERQIAKRIANAEAHIDSSLNQVEDVMGDIILSKRPGDIPVVNAVDINPVNADLVISGAERGDLRVWDHTTGQTLFCLHQNNTTTTTTQQHSPHRGDITSVQWLHNGVMALSASLDCTVKLWLASQYGKCLKTFVGHNRGVVQVGQCLTQKNHIFSIGKDGRLLVFNIGTNPKEAVSGPEYDYEVLTPAQVGDDEESLVSFTLLPLLASETAAATTTSTTTSTSTTDTIISPQQHIIVCSTLGVHLINLSSPSTNNQQLIYPYRGLSSSTLHNHILYLGTATGSLIVFPLHPFLPQQQSQQLTPNKSTSTDPDATGPVTTTTTTTTQTTTPTRSSTHPEGQQPILSPTEYALFDEAITALKWFNNELLVTTFQGDCAALSPDCALQPHLFSGTDQPLRGFDVKFDPQLGSTVVIGCGDDGLFQWRF